VILGKACQVLIPFDKFSRIIIAPDQIVRADLSDGDGESIVERGDADEPLFERNPEGLSLQFSIILI